MLLHRTTENSKDNLWPKLHDCQLLKAKNVYDSFYCSILTREAFGALNCEPRAVNSIFNLNADSYSVFLYFLVAPCVRLCNKRNSIKRRPSLKDLESLLESKLKPIQTQAPHHSRLDALFKKVDDNYKALQARLDSLEARNASLEAENAKLVSKLQFCEASLNNLEQYIWHP